MLFYMRWEKKALPESIPKDRVHMSHWSVRSSLNYRIVEEKRNKTKSVTQATVLYPLSWHVRVNSSYTTKSFKQENLQNDLFFTEKNSSPMAFTTATLENGSPCDTGAKTPGLVHLPAHSSLVGNSN